jgi:hypothetical protein
LALGLAFDGNAHESNWLPAPAGNFKLMLRAYLPGRAVLDGEYHVPPVERAT